MTVAGEVTLVDPLAALHDALAAFQAELPTIDKANTAQVRSDKGNYSYRYADLAEVSGVVLPLLAKHGLCWTSMPTMLDGEFVLSYDLRHVDGGSIGGFYPLGRPGRAQDMGSAITYARRYALCAVTGVAPDQDDDGYAAHHSYVDAAPAAEALRREAAAITTPVEAARAGLVAKMHKIDADPDSVLAAYAAEFGGADPRTDTDAERIRDFTERLGAGA